ncbi:hypothetical protein ACWCYY_12580 [Kitasatospora sp. NPDC001664]
MREGGGHAVKGSGSATASGQSSVANSGVINGDVHVGIRAPAPSGYLHQVGDIAAAEFRGREAELAELAAFCTAEAVAASYWRWLAPAWAGKSALLAQLVLDPPPGVDIVSFFITSRMAAQNDAAAFCAVVQRQLYELLGEEEPLTTPYTRDEQLRLAIDRAARRCAERGRRLVLVVDGLDEDRGVTAGPESHSIAALLPRVPAHGMRIVVAGRPHPPVPEDVGQAHPLRSTEIDHWLAPSPHAQAVRSLAERDLVRLLDGGGLGRELVGLTVAAGGGLTAADLAALTGSRPRLVERELSAVDGRSFRRRSATWRADGPDAYLLAHEEIQRSAAELVMEVELKAHQERLHAWADTYREAGWPEETPEYLLRGYAQLLQEVGGSRRLAQLVCDPARHERLWLLTGSDFHGLSELSAAMDLTLAEGRRTGRHDVGTAVAVAVARDRLHGRMVNLPHRLIALWARLGDADRAVGLARSQRGVVERPFAFAAAAEQLAAGGHLSHAVGLADAVGDPEDRARVLTAIVLGLAEAGRYGDALRFALEMPAGKERAEALLGALKALVAADGGGGAADVVTVEPYAAAALEALDDATDVMAQAEHRCALAVVLRRMGEVERATELVNGVLATAYARDWASGRAHVLAIVAREISSDPVLGALGRETAVAMAELFETVTEPEQMEWLFADVAPALVAAGRADLALLLADRFPADEAERGWARALVGCAVAAGGDLAAALGLAEHLDDPRDAVAVLNAAGAVLGAAGATEECGALAEMTLDAVDEWVPPRDRVELLVGTADFLCTAGLVQEARSVAAAATSLARDSVVSRGSVEELSVLARVLGGAGHHDLGRRVLLRAAGLADEAEPGLGRAMDLAHVLGGSYAVQSEGESERMLESLTEEVGSLRLVDRPSALAAMAEALGGAGRFGEAYELARQLGELAEAGDSPYRRGWDRYSAARAYLAAGDVNTALALSEDLPLDAIPELLSAAVEKLVDAGDLARAVAVTDSIDDAMEHERSLGYLAGGLAAAGDFGQAVQRLAEIDSPVMCDRAKPLVARGMARAGQPEAALAVAESVTDLERRSKSLASVAEAWGTGERGRALLVEALALGPWEQVLPELAKVAPECLLLLADLVLADGQHA